MTSQHEPVQLNARSSRGGRRVNKQQGSAEITTVAPQRISTYIHTPSAIETDKPAPPTESHKDRSDLEKVVEPVITTTQLDPCIEAVARRENISTGFGLSELTRGFYDGFDGRGCSPNSRYYLYGFVEGKYYAAVVAGTKRK